MDNTPEAKSTLDSIKLFLLLQKWRKQLLITAIISLVVSFVFTLPFFMTPMYKATTVVYPVNLQAYSTESPTEQMVQLLKSEDVWMQLVNTFDLYKHYEVDSTGPYPRFEIMKYLQKNIDISKTEFESIEIHILDKDPVRAARMCDSLLVFTDKKALQLNRQRSIEKLVIAKKQLEEKKSEIDSIERTLSDLRKNYGITDFERQVEGFSREYYRTLSSGRVNSDMDRSRKNMEEKGGEYILLKEMLLRASGLYSEYLIRYEKALSESTMLLDYHNIITKATPPERKDSPKRTIIMLLFTLSMMAIAILAVLYLEHYRKKLNEVPID